MGDEDHNVQKIEFLSPCTLISGPNGTGKTTTIEALNYIVTGQMPTVKKQAFIHSTDVARKTRIDASVTLEFIDVKGRRCTAVRRLVATNSVKNAAQAEEHTLAVKYPDGTTQTLSSKVCDFNKAILHHLGVPKSIFKYVIFCHQEDSCWPLSEPKELKRRFDDIFQLTKFVKAQERMKKIMGDFTKELNTHGVSEKLFKTHLKEKIITTEARDKCIEKITRGKEVYDELREKKRLGSERVNELKDSIQQLEEINTTIRKNEAESDNLKKQLALIRVDPYYGTEAELLQQIEELSGSDGNNYNDERTKIERKISRNNHEKQELTRIKLESESKVSSLKAEAIHREAMRNELQVLESCLRSELDLEDDAALDIELDHSVNAKVQELKQTAQTVIKSYITLQSEFRTAQEEVTKIEVELKGMQNDRVKMEREVEQLKLKMKQGENATSGMKELLKKEEQLRRNLAALPEVDEDALRDCKFKKERIIRELDELKAKCLEAEKNAEEDKEKESLQKTVTIAKKKITAYERRHEKNWKGLIGHVPEFPWTEPLTKALTKLRNDKKTMEEDVHEVQLNMQKLETMKQQYLEQEKTLVAQELKLNEEISEAGSCEPEEVSEKLSNLRRRLKKARKDLAPISAKSDIYDSYVEETKSSGCCPLCERNFASKKAIADFTQRLQDLTLNLPAEQEKLEAKVLSMEMEECKLVKAEGQAKVLEKIVKELKEIREKSKAASREMEDEKESLVTNQGQLSNLNNKMKLAEELQAEVGVIEQLCDQTNEQEERLQHLLSMKASDGPSYSELRERSEQKEMEYRSIIQQGEELQKSSEEKNKLQSKLNELGTHRVSLGEAAAQAGAFAEQLDKKKQEIEKIIKDMERKREEDLPDAKFSREELGRQLAAKDEERKKAEMEMQLKKKELEQRKQQWETLTRNVNESEKSVRKLMEQENNVRTINERLEENQQRQKRFEEDMRSFDSLHQKELVLKDQLTRMKLEKKLKDVERILANVRRQADPEELTALKREYLKLQNDLQNIGNEEVKVHTQVQEYEKQQAVAEAKLSSKEFQRAELNYRDTIIEIALLEESINDLTKYRKCLDASLIQFHTEKMAAVNVIIDELWRKVYNSTDITTIRIRSETPSEANSKRSYDYNVMMVSETGSEVEMRGRCSAGQKMLASLLIRIALAEVFAGMCSMIALDEPTTNLDEWKVEGMANVISDLIDARRRYDVNGTLAGREMQMVIITHDERLVNKLTLSCRPDYIYTLGKDEHGISFISKRFPDGSEKRVNSDPRDRR